MFGSNQVLARDRGDGMSLWVQEVFPTLQGEGPLTGTPAVFVRLAGCNLACHFCDTEFESSEWHPTIDELVESIRKMSGNSIDLVVLTGGEPLRQNVTPLCAALLSAMYNVQIETAGTVWPDGLGALFESGNGTLSVVCSPKTATVHVQVAQHCRDYKYVVSASDRRSPDDGLPMSSTQVQGRPCHLFRPPTGFRIWVQPRDEYTPEGIQRTLATRENVELCVSLSLKYGYRMSLQTHKMLGLP